MQIDHVLQSERDTILCDGAGTAQDIAVNSLRPRIEAPAAGPLN